MKSNNVKEVRAYSVIVKRIRRKEEWFKKKKLCSSLLVYSIYSLQCELIETKG